MIPRTFTRLALFLATTALAVQGAPTSSSLPWTDTSVSAPKDFVVTGFGLGCLRQFVFKRGGVSNFDQTWSYSVIGLKEKRLSAPVLLNQSHIDRNAPLSVVNASAGHFRGAYVLPDDNDYALMPIQFDGCDAGVPYDKYQIKASKPGQADWYSPQYAVNSFANPDQVMNLKAIRDSTDKSKVHVSWETYDSQNGREVTRPMAAFIIAGRSEALPKLRPGTKDNLVSQYVEEGVLKATIDVGPLAVNVTVVRYDKKSSGGLSMLDNAPQVEVKLEI